MAGLVTLLTVFLVGFSGALGCGSDDGGASPGAPEPATAAPETSSASPAEGSPEEAEAEAEDPGRDLAGLRAVVNEDGTIVLSGTNRWGERFETTYADLGYFEGAVPVWKRSISADQGDALDAFLAELKAEAGTEEGAEDGAEEESENQAADEAAAVEAPGTGGPETE